MGMIRGNCPSRSKSEGVTLPNRRMAVPNGGALRNDLLVPQVVDPNDKFGNLVLPLSGVRVMF